MTRINTNVSALTAQRYLGGSNTDMNATLQRLSSGLRITRGADDPAGLIASENLRSEMAGLTQAIDNTQRASNVIATAEGALAEVASLLTTVKGLVVEAANTGALSDEEIEANQLQVDSAIESITRIANATTFAGLSLLNGNMSYQTSGVATSAITSLQLFNAQLGSRSSMNVTVSGISAAQQGQLSFTPATVSADVTLEVASNRGVEVFNFISGYSDDDIVTAINAVTDTIGVEASAAVSTGIVFRSVDYGTDAFVSVRTLPSSTGGFPVKNAGGTTTQRDAGSDVAVAINGAYCSGNGRDVSLNTNSLDLAMTLDAAFGSGSSDTFAITGGGVTFQLGPHISTSEQMGLGIDSIVASNLGSSELGFLNELATGGSATLVGGQTATASSIIDKAILQISQLRGRLGAFERNTLDTNINSLSITLENVTASESSIRDADFAAETANLTRSQILVSAGTSVLGMANQTPQTVLSLLQG